MASLEGDKPSASYTSLLKLDGNTDSTVAGASGNAIQVKTGDNDDTPLYLNTDRIGIGIADPDCALEVNGAMRGRKIDVTAAGPTDNLDVSAANVVFLDTSSNNVTIGGLTGGVAGQEIVLYKPAAANDATLEHAEGANQNIFLLSGDDETISNYGGWHLVCSGSHWFAMGK